MDSPYGAYTSIAIGSDEFPVIGYKDPTTTGLKIFHCSTVDCSDGAGSAAGGITIFDPDSHSVGNYASTAVGVSGDVIVSYLAWSPNALVVAVTVKTFTGVVFN